MASVALQKEKNDGLLAGFFSVDTKDRCAGLTVIQIQVLVGEPAAAVKRCRY